MNRLQAYARERGWTQAQLAEHLGVSVSQANKYCQPRGAKNASGMTRRVADRLKTLTDGAIHAGNFDDDVDEVMP